MKRRGATLEHAQPQRARAELDSDSLSTLRRFIALAHYASVGGPGHSNCLLCQEAIRERARLTETSLVRLAPKVARAARGTRTQGRGRKGRESR